jgi:hypothetical protein
MGGGERNETAGPIREWVQPFRVWFDAWPPRVMAALHGSNAYSIRAIGAPRTHRRSIGRSSGCPLASNPKPLLRTLNNGYSLRYCTNVTPSPTPKMMVFFQMGVLPINNYKFTF